MAIQSVFCEAESQPARYSSHQYGGATSGISRRSWTRIATSAAVLSLAAMTKLTILVWLYLPDRRTAAEGVGEYVAAVAIGPLVILTAMYNFVVQYLFTAYELIIYDSGSDWVPAGNPRVALNDALVAVVGTTYNLRWRNLTLLVPAAALAVIVLVGFKL